MTGTGLKERRKAKMDKENGVTRLTWEDVMDAIEVLSVHLGGKKLFGIPRGGLIVAALLSYRGCERVPLLDHGVYAVDDIADTGQTLLGYGERGIKTAALYKRKGCAFVPDTYAYDIDSSDYILFPWELGVDPQWTPKS
jgi:hypoxanthine phosphoribosyltransferase